MSPAANATARAVICGATSLIVASSWAGSCASAAEVDDQAGLITETVASRDRLKTYDTIKLYGAQTVLDRDRGYLEPDGLRAGNYLIYPSAGALVIYDDNIFRSDANKASDIRTELTPEVKFVSQLPRHVLDFSLAGRIVDFAENDSQSYANVRATADGALHFDHAHTLSASVLSAIEHEERGELTAPRSAAKPVQVFHNRASAGITRDVGRLYGTLSVTGESWDYSDVTALDGSRLDQDARDTTVLSGQLRAGYRFSPGYELVAKFRALHQSNRGDAKTDRDAAGWEVLTGLAIESSPLLRWRLLAGYGARDFEQADMASTSDFVFEGQVQWLATERLTIHGSAKRWIADTSGPDDLGRIETTLSLRADVELRHNLVLTAGVAYTDAEFLGLSRQDQIFGARIGLEYYHTQNWLFTAGYEFQVRDSTEPLYDMTRNRFMVGAKLSF